MNWLAHVLGLDDISGRWYAWWSGFGGDLTEFAAVGALWGVVRRHNCDIHGCWRWGILPTQVGDVTHHVCKRHHPGAPKPQDLSRT